MCTVAGEREQVDAWCACRCADTRRFIFLVCAPQKRCVLLDAANTRNSLTATNLDRMCNEQTVIVLLVLRYAPLFTIVRRGRFMFKLAEPNRVHLQVRIGFRQGRPTNQATKREEG